jgi:hypothetical protein
MVKVSLCLINQATPQEGVWQVDVQNHVLPTLALNGDQWSASRFAALRPGKERPEPIR